MEKKLTCIECPIGCALSVDIENCKAVRVAGNKCPRGTQYATTECEDPRRILTSSVRCEGLSVKMLPVRTDKPIPKARLLDAMAEVKKVRLAHPVEPGDVIIRDILGLKADLVASGRAERAS